MLQEATTVLVEMLFEDKKGKQAQLRVRFPFGISLPNLIAASDAIANAAQQLSNAAIRAITYRWLRDEDETPAPAPDSAVTRKTSLYYRNTLRWEAIYVPSARMDLLEMSGPYAGIRLDAANVEVQAALSALALALVQLRTPENETFPQAFVVGGVAL